MEKKLCDICQKRLAIIQVSGEGNFCLTCNNSRVLKSMGIEDTFRYAPVMKVREQDGTVRAFHVEHMVLGRIVSWNATELDGDYRFRYISDVRTNGVAAAKEFAQKIEDGVRTKTLEKTFALPSRGSGITALRDKGTIHIVDDDEQENEVAFLIDGNKFSVDDFAALLSPYIDFKIQYQICDESESILKEDEYLVPVRITKESLVGELRAATIIHESRGLLSYKAVSAFDETFYTILDKLEVFYRCKRDDAIEAGRELVRMLVQIETDDDWFPRAEIEAICSVVDPYGEDEEIKRIVREWEEDY